MADTGERRVIRDAAPADMATVRGIYAWHVAHGVATFDEAAPTTEALIRQHAGVIASGLPFLAAELDGQIAGYAYAGPYRARSAYRYTIEDSVYVARGAEGRGVGTALLSTLIARCEAGPWRQMLAVIGDSANAGSVALHRRLGFNHVGTFGAVGFKHGRWVDTVLMQRRLGAGDATVPNA